MDSHGLSVDPSNGYEPIADSFIADRNPGIGIKTFEAWMKSLPPLSTVLDIGCGFGVPHSKLLLDSGFKVFGIDASPSLINEFRRRFPNAMTECEAAETSNFFNLKFDGIIAIGLIFLLSEAAQLKVLKRVSEALNPNGKFLFTAPFQICSWKDLLTGRKSRSLGKEVYVKELSKQGLFLDREYTDEGENHYFDFFKK